MGKTGGFFAGTAIAIAMMTGTGTALGRQEVGSPAAQTIPAQTIPAQTTPAQTTPAPQTATPLPQGAPVPQAPETAAPGARPSAKPEKKKKGKEVYTGPTNVVVLPAMPMLDAEGRQQLDPDAKPMFNAPVSQKRDKKGHPMFDEKGKPIFTTPEDMGYDEKGKKIHVKKVPPPKKVPLNVSRGTLTVDGMTGKAALNYDIADFKYLYLYAPWIGITVVSNASFPGAKEQKGAFNDKSLVVTVEEHKLELASDKRMLSKKAESAFVLVDRDFRLPSKFPEVGFGTIRKPPYAWPGSKPNAELKGPVKAPPLPKNLMPTQALAPCPAGQMRKPGPPALPGQKAPVEPCVPVVTKPVPVKLPTQPGAPAGTQPAGTAGPALKGAPPAAPATAPAPAPAAVPPLEECERIKTAQTRIGGWCGAADPVAGPRLHSGVAWNVLA